MLVPIAPSDRQGRLEATRLLKMASSTHAYVRGNTVKFYEWLAASPSAALLPQGPSVWICGDCHLGNLGPIANADGQVAVQIRDLDQCVIGNPAHDLIRLGLSLATAARGSDLPGVTTARMIEEMVDGYERALSDEADAAPEPEVVRAVRRRALGRGWKELAAERLDDVAPTIPLGKKFWALTTRERDALGRLFENEAVRDQILALAHRDPQDKVRLLDAAYWMKGCSSLGTARYAAIVAVGGSKRVPDSIALVDLKEAVPAAAPAARDAAMPADHAARVVAGARALAPHLGERMLATRLLGKPMVLRELLPQDLKLEVDQFTKREATRAARYLAYVVGAAHARQMDKGERAAWLKILRNHRGAGIEAPSWLWKSVVELIASHEAGYLEHCRRYALAQAG
ncbi:DUF2252 domain-containing protein [Sphingomonas montanisoli]|uniref:DUF2252 domain-containing protein n=2 Tax=Sphingomonas montanisoli TaxID=2606412 RepID=A0A5D9C4C6_9SPHN|nr:DUF2252 family protein [Sphingomonas montanisoli]TZG26539.1 DUF2252 domain-containing protein [Sphingomonas montanisoli]